MPDRDLGESDKGRKSGIEYVPLDVNSERIRAVKHAEGYPESGARFHAAVHRRNVGEIAGSRVLHLEDHHIHVGQRAAVGRIGAAARVGRARRSARPDYVLVERAHLKPGYPVDASADLFAGSQHPSRAVLGRENRGYGIVFVENIYREPVIGREPGAGRDDAEAASFKQTGEFGFENPVYAEFNSRGFLHYGSSGSNISTKSRSYTLELRTLKCI